MSNNALEGIKNSVFTQIYQAEKDTRYPLVLPRNYNPTNAYESAMLKIAQTQDRNGRLAIHTCTSESIVQALFRMLTLGLDPEKSQCAFIVYGDK